MMDSDCRRAWSLHFGQLAKEYRDASRLSMSLARAERSRAKRAHWVMDARRLARAARKCAAYAIHFPDTEAA
jgi:hypothetical protein